MAGKIMKCGLGDKCLCKDCEINKDDKSTFVICGTEKTKRYYHPKCAESRANIEKMKTLWRDSIDGTVMIGELTGFLNKLAYTSKIDSDYMWFALKYVVDHKMNLNHIYGFKYYLNNSQIKKAWEDSRKPKAPTSAEIKDAHEKTNTNKVPEFKKEPETKFDFKSNSSFGFGAILRGNRT